MKKEDKSGAKIRLKDAEEFLLSAKSNLELGRFKASLDHSVDAAIAANDALQKVTKNLAEKYLKKAERFVSWVKSKIG